jgi:S-adenosylmethionine:tRNA ribosyltransferase-isomerase
LIAQHPCEPRDASRLMVLRRATGQIEHAAFRDLADYLGADDCLVLNKTRVLPAKFVARRATGGKLDALFVRELSPGRWHVMLSGAKRVRAGEALSLDGTDARMKLLRRLDRGLCEVDIDPSQSAEVVLAQIGSAPLPPYIRRDEGDASLRRADRQRYQTVFASTPGAVAAPTAGLHFTSDLLDDLRRKGVTTVEVLLHVGLGTFQPVEVSNLADHPMHSEYFELSQEAATRIDLARSGQGRAIAVGTTSVRVLETCGRDGELRPQSGWTDILIYPPYEFRITDVLLTNFHLPGSTLLALVCALAGREFTMRAYSLAVRERYRFYSYGDAMLIL